MSSVTQPVRNGPTVPPPPPPQPTVASNAGLMRGQTVVNERYSGGRTTHQFPGEFTPAVRYSAGAQIKQAVANIMAKIASAQLELEKDGLIGQPLPFFKAAAENEPETVEHASAPTQQLRPRSEVIVVGSGDNGRYVLAIDKGDYLLFPGGGVSDGEMPRDAALRETLEECGCNLSNLTSDAVVESIWPKDFPGAADGFKGERSYFFTAVDSNDSGMSHPDRESFTKMSLDDALRRLDELITDPDQEWAKANNELRRDLIQKMRDCTDRDLVSKKMAQAGVVAQVAGITPTADQEFANELVASATQPGEPMPKAPNEVPNLPKQAQVVPDDAGLIPGYPFSRLLPQVNANSLQRANADADAAAKQKADYERRVRESTERKPALQHQAHLLKKQGDAVVLQPRQEHVLFTPDGKLVARRASDRRFEFPADGRGRPAPYEDPITFVPEAGVQEPGYHGYRIGLNVGDSDALPEGYEAIDPNDALKDLYASMGLARNKQYRQLDRARARVIVRALRKRRQAAAAPVSTPPVSMAMDAESAVSDGVPPPTPE